MGGYGTLFGCLKYPEKFNVGVALSPLISFLDLIDYKMISPIYKLVYGKKKAEDMGKKEVEDILDTADLIFTDKNRLIPSIKRNSNGEIIEMNESSKKKWLEYEIIEILKNSPEPFRNMKILINCEMKDEFGFSAQTKKLQKVLTDMGIEKEVDIDIYFNKNSEKLSPHEVGIGFHLFPGILYCLKNLG